MTRDRRPGNDHIEAVRALGLEVHTAPGAGLGRVWPVGLAWLALSLAGAYRARDRSSEARVERRVARLLLLYPPRWQSRYGQEFAELLRETIRSGHGGPRLTLNVVREGTAAWWQTPEGRRALLPPPAGGRGIPLVAQGRPRSS